MTWCDKRVFLHLNILNMDAIFLFLYLIIIINSEFQTIVIDRLSVYNEFFLAMEKVSFI